MFRLFSRKNPTTRLKQERMEQARREQVGQPMLHDPIEDDPAYLLIMKAVDSEIEAAFASKQEARGTCHRQWSMKRKVLLEKHGIVWFSPAELNPGLRLD